MITAGGVMPIVKVLRNHVFNGTIRRVGDKYEINDTQAGERIRVGLVAPTEAADFVAPGIVAKTEYAMYAPRQFRIPETGIQKSVPLSIVRRAGSWWFFSDDTKVLGQSAAAEKLGVTVEEFLRDYAPSFA